MHLCERRGGKLQAALVSIVYAPACWWELAGKLPYGRDLQCRCLLEEKKMYPEQVVGFKGPQPSKEKKDFCQRKGHKLGRVQIITI